MKVFILSALLISPLFAFAGESLDASTAATIVRQEAVEICLADVENNQKGTAQFLAITLESMTNTEDSTTSVVKLDGSTVVGDVVESYWEILVEIHSSEDGNTYSCNVTKSN